MSFLIGTWQSAEAISTSACTPSCRQHEPDRQFSSSRRDCGGCCVKPVLKRVSLADHAITSSSLLDSESRCAA